MMQHIDIIKRSELSKSKIYISSMTNMKVQMQDYLS